MPSLDSNRTRFVQAIYLARGGYPSTLTQGLLRRGQLNTRTRKPAGRKWPNTDIRGQLGSLSRAYGTKPRMRGGNGGYCQTT
jgi:hypothetical protein